MKHNKYDEIYTLVKNNINVLLTSEAGTGKTTLLRTIAEDLGLDFYAISMTRQTTLNSLLGFISINGNYIESPLRKAVENGGMLLFDEIDAADPNVILCMNTIENGFMSFPDKVVNVHPDFRWVATANPQDKHNIYTGRSKLDAATLSRFDIIELPLDPNLEINLTSKKTVDEINIMRKVLKENNIDKTISMRDSIRYHKRKQLGIEKNYYKVLLGNPDVYENYEEKIKGIEENKPKSLEQCKTITELWDSLPIVEDGLSQEKENAKHIAKQSLSSATYVPPEEWGVTIEPSYSDNDMSIIVYNSNSTKTYVFKQKDLL